MTDIFFRVDGNSIIATGHIMRCLTIARACLNKMLEKGCCQRIVFVVSDKESEEMLRQRMADNDTFEIINLHCDYTKPEQDNLTSGSKDSNNKPWIFVDTYYASPSYFKALSNHFKVAYLDDLRCFPCEVDLVINYDTDEPCAFYNSAKYKLLGAQYTPLREQFMSVNYIVRPTVENILLSTGGTDPYHIAEILLNHIYGMNHNILRNMHTHIITGRSNKRFEALCELAKANPNIHIHEGVTDMASLMASCDIAVSAGGTTLCELAAVGVPTISYAMADNQLTAVETFAEKNLVPYAGDVRSENEPVDFATIDSIIKFLTQMSHNFDSRKKSSELLRTFIDGCGAAKIAEALFQ